MNFKNIYKNVRLSNYYKIPYVSLISLIYRYTQGGPNALIQEVLAR